MSKTKIKYPNRLFAYRQRLGYTQGHLARLSGCKLAQTVRRIENGKVMPSAVTLLRLSAALRAPVEFLYEETYLLLREEVRICENQLPKGRQGVLPLPL